MKILQECAEFWKNDWRNNRQLFFVENIGIILGLVPAILIAVFTAHSPFLLIYIFFLLANLLLIVAAYKRKSSPIMILNLGYVIINLIGIWSSIGGI